MSDTQTNRRFQLRSAYIYGLVHNSQKFFKIGKAVSIVARAKYIGEENFTWSIGVALRTQSERKARRIERCAHDAMGEWKMGSRESDSIPMDGSTEWFSTKGLADFLYWCWANEDRLGFKECRFRDVIEADGKSSSYEGLNIFRIIRNGIEPSGRGAYLKHQEDLAIWKGPPTSLHFEISACGEVFSITSKESDLGFCTSRACYTVDFSSRWEAIDYENWFAGLLADWRVSAVNGRELVYGPKWFSCDGWNSAKEAIGRLWIAGRKVSYASQEAEKHRSS